MNKLTIAIVDDEEIFSKPLADYLAATDWIDPQVFASPGELLAALDPSAIDLLLIDIELNNPRCRDGELFAIQQKNHHGPFEHVPIVILSKHLTAESAREEIRRHRGLGLYYLPKTTRPPGIIAFMTCVMRDRIRPAAAPES